MTPFDTCKAWKAWRNRQRPIYWITILYAEACVATTFLIVGYELTTADGLPTDFTIRLAICYSAGLALVFCIGVAMEIKKLRQALR